jgi:transcriptional regulator with XRE-family HTH domain
VADAPTRDRGEKWRHLVKVVGTRIKLARQEREWSLEELAERAKTDKGAISRIENGEKPEVSAGLIFDVCRALNADPSLIWWGKAFLDDRPALTLTPTAPEASEVRSSKKR